MKRTAHDVESETKPVLVFVYNAESGLFNTLGDVAHKVLSPETYACNLCALTHTAFRVRREWTQFLQSLDAHTEFLHADELRARYGMTNLPLPAILRRRHDEASLQEFIPATAINSCRTLDELKQLIMEYLKTMNDER